jgi:hypothetical protein
MGNLYNIWNTNLQDANLLRLTDMYIFAAQKNSHLVCDAYLNYITVFLKQGQMAQPPHR